MRKFAATLAVLALALGALGAGISATFSDQVTAQQDITVGSLGCTITNTTAGTIAPGNHSVSYAVPMIDSPEPGSAPFTFTVKVTGSYTVNLHLTQTTPAAPFTSLLVSPADVQLAPNGTHDYAAGLQWTDLGSGGQTASITYTVDCTKYVAPPPPVLPANTYVPPSTNSANEAAGHPYFVAVPQQGAVQLTFYDAGGTVACFEYRTDGDNPEQRLGPGEVVGATPFLANYHGVNPPNSGPGYLGDGQYSYICPGHAIYGMAGASYGDPATITVPVTQYVEVRLVFGAERDYDFDWTLVNGL